MVFSLDSKNTVAIFVATSYLTTAVSILLVSVDNSQMNIYNSLKTQRNNQDNPLNQHLRMALLDTFVMQ